MNGTQRDRRFHSDRFRGDTHFKAGPDRFHQLAPYTLSRKVAP